MLLPKVILAALLLATGAPALAADLYFSEYIEGSSNNKALEIWNGTGASVSLAGYEVAFHFNGSTTAGLTIALTGTVASGDVFVLAHASAVSAILDQADQTGSGGWYNGDDAVVLLNGGLPIDVIGQIGLDPGSQWGTGDQSTQDNTLQRSTSVTAGDPDGSDAFDPAVEWLGQPTDTFTGLGLYPDSGAGPTPLAIAEIQGAGHDSPVEGEFVETAGVVTAVDFNGFYLQDATGDGDPQTSEGIFVFTSTAPTVAVGDGVTVSGTVSEFQPGGATTSNLTTTELTGPSITVNSTGNLLPTPVTLGAAGSLPPTETIDDDAFADFDPESDGIDFHESLEGMRVLVDDALAVSARNVFDEIFTVTDGGAFATRINPRSGITIGELDFNPERIQVQIDGDLLPGFDPAVDTGDALGDVVGVVSYGFGNFEVKATQPFTVTDAGLLPETLDGGDADTLDIATYNVLNLDPKVESLALVVDADDIDDDVGDGRFARLAAHIVDNLQAPDIIGLQEIQDNDGAELTTGTDASLTYTTLIDAIVEAGGPVYEYRDIAPDDDASGGQPGGNIRVGYLFDPARVVFHEHSLLKLLDPDLGDGDAFLDARHPLVGTFEFQGRKVTLINNHFTSKSGSTPLFGLVQPPINAGLDQRIAQAGVVHDFVDGLLAADPDAHVVVLGDLNEFSFFEPIAVLKGVPAPILADPSDSLDELERYSYVFEGNSQDLDHILVSGSLAAVASYDIVHVNVEFQDPASDHDPIVARITFPEVCQPDLGFGGPGGATLAVCGDPLATTGSATMTMAGLPAGAAGFLFFGLTNAPLATHGGVLVPIPAAGIAFLPDTDLDGLISLPVPGALADVPVSIFVQFVYADSSVVPSGFGFTNAVEIQLLGL